MIPDELLPTGESESSPTALAVPAVPVPTLQKSEVHRFIKPSPINAATQPSLSLISTHLPVSTLSAAVESEKEPAPVIDTEQPQSPKHVSVFAPVLASDPVPFQEKVLVKVVVEEEMVVVGVEEKEEKEEKKVMVEEKEVEVPVVRLEWSVSQEPVLGAGVAVAVVADESCSPSLDRKHALVGSE
jgi:hypothetical protein